MNSSSGAAIRRVGTVGKTMGGKEEAEEEAEPGEVVGDDGRMVWEEPGAGTDSGNGP